ncbi:Ig-like domain-containing protein [Burkholderia sp. Nafp2/4-1b]|uniref:Ig-like domain-containing protein n=1 Tax=Burkholderia sp. Nafp2/4-1b TaxID=2116686 RepID=UPI0013CE982A|nr:Ig-like domain-containing protein [Burkholderia sp. Nafp2/4-1b]
MRDAVVTFSADNNALLSPSKTAATDVGGHATAVLTYGMDKTNRTSTATASVGKVSSGSVSVAIGGTTIAVSAPASIAVNDTETVTATVSDASGVGVPGVSVALASAAGSAIVPTPTLTDSNGVAAFAVTPTQVGSESLTANITGASAVQAVTLMAATAGVKLFAAPSSISSGQPNNSTVLSAKAVDGNGNPVAGVQITFSATNGNGAVNPSQATTDSSGIATTTLTTGADKSNRNIFVTAAASNGQTGSIPVEVTGTRIAVGWPLETPTNASTSYSITLLDGSNQPITNAAVNVAIVTGGDVVLGGGALTTDGNGIARFNLKAGSSAGAFSMRVTYGSQNQTFDGSAGDDFTKIDADGSALPFNAESWSCVRDNKSLLPDGRHLWWEVKTNDSGLRDMNTRYTNFGSQNSSGSDEDASTFVNNVNGKALCGKNDWTLPGLVTGSTVAMQLLENSVMDVGGWSHAVDWLPNTLQDYYWTNEETIVNNPSSEWAVDITALGDHLAELSMNRRTPLPVRLVRIEP